jgi:hypothetical protein
MNDIDVALGCADFNFTKASVTGVLAAEVRRLREENERLKADVERYRWLRNKVKKAPASMDGPSHPQLFFGWDFWNESPETHNADGLDAAIDAARGDSSQAQNGGGE